jgi:hypothetical protein
MARVIQDETEARERFEKDREDLITRERVY